MKVQKQCVKNRRVNTTGIYDPYFPHICCNCLVDTPHPSSCVSPQQCQECLLDPTNRWHQHNGYENLIVTAQNAPKCPENATKTKTNWKSQTKCQTQELLPGDWVTCLGCRRLCSELRNRSSTLSDSVSTFQIILFSEYNLLHNCEMRLLTNYVLQLWDRGEALLELG